MERSTTCPVIIPYFFGKIDCAFAEVAIFHRFIRTPVWIYRSSSAKNTSSQRSGIDPILAAPAVSQAFWWRNDLEVAEHNAIQSSGTRARGPIEVSIVCVNWNSLSYLRESIASIYQHTSEIKFEIIVVDNASPDGGGDVLQAEFPEITAVKSGKNLGFAGASNLGFQNSSGSSGMSV